MKKQKRVFSMSIIVFLSSIFFPYALFAHGGGSTTEVNTSDSTNTVESYSETEYMMDGYDEEIENSDSFWRYRNGMMGVSGIFWIFFIISIIGGIYVLFQRKRSPRELLDTRYARGEIKKEEYEEKKKDL